MKRINLLLTPIVGLSSIATMAIPATSCSQEDTTHIIYRGAKHFAISAGDNVDLNIVLDRVYTKDEIKSIELITDIDDFFAYTFDINDTVLTIHLVQALRYYEYDKEFNLDVKIKTNDWTDSIKNIKFNYTIEKGSGLRAWAFADTIMSYELESGIDMHISYDGKEWEKLPSGENEIIIDTSKSIWLKGTNNTGLKGEFKIAFRNAIDDTKPSIDLLGTPNSLIYGDDGWAEKTLPANAFEGLFYESVGINYVSSNFLPSTKISNECYSEMFSGCTNLLNAPSLPANKLADFCYYEMFYECTNLTTPPALPAEFLADYCYASMFEKCSSLIEMPALNATKHLNDEGEEVEGLPQHCYDCMFRKCIKLNKISQLPAMIMGEYSYDSMFKGCTSLTKAPDLPATTLNLYCYASMFYGCTSLTKAPDLQADILFTGCYQFMFYNCVSLTSAPALNATMLANECYQYMFNGCTSLTKVQDELPAKTLYEACYNGLFRGCEKLITPPKIPAQTLAKRCCSSMFYQCESLISAPELPVTTLEEDCYKQMFEKCTSLKISESEIIGHKIITAQDVHGFTESPYSDMFTNTKGRGEEPYTPVQGKTYYYE